MFEKFTALATWAAALSLVPKIIVSVVAVLVVVLFLWLLWFPHQTNEEFEETESETKPEKLKYVVTVTSFENSHNMDHRLAVVAAINSTGYKVRDDGKAWKNPGEAWESWYSSVYPKLSEPVIQNTDIFILHRDSLDQAKLVEESLSGIFPNLRIRTLKHGASKTPYISVYVSSRNSDRFSTE